MALQYPHTLGETQLKRCFTPVFFEVFFYYSDRADPIEALPRQFKMSAICFEKL